MFCGTVFAKTFQEEYQQVDLDNLYGANGIPASSRWFSADGRRNEKVYVSTLFGLILGILRQKSSHQVPFLKTNDFTAVVNAINALDLQAISQNSEEAFEVGQEANLERLKSLTEALQAQLSAATKEILVLREKIRRLEDPTLHPGLPTPPSTPSPPKVKSPPNLLDKRGPPKRRRTIEETKSDEDLTSASKKKKIRQTAVELKNEVINLCERNGESLVNVLGECSRLPGEDSRGIRELFTSVFDSRVEEKGVRTAFAKPVSEETWEERIKAMRVPDWIYLLFS